MDVFCKLYFSLTYTLLSLQTTKHCLVHQETQIHWWRGRGKRNKGSRGGEENKGKLENRERTSEKGGAAGVLFSARGGSENLVWADRV